MAAGFWSGFAQGWEAESERIERRKLFMEEQKAGRVNTLAELIARRGGAGRRSSGGGGGEGESATPNSVEHNTEVLLNYGYTPDQIASLTAQGPYALQAAAETTSKVVENKGQLTPSLFDSISKSIVVTVDAGEEVDPEAFAAELFGPEFAETLSPEDTAYLGALGEAQPSVQVTSTFIPEEPYDVAKANQVVDAANDALAGTLEARRGQLSDMLQGGDISQEDSAMIAEELAEVGKAIDELKTGNAVPGIRLVGADIIQPYLDQDPELRNAPPGILGNWGMVINQNQGQPQNTNSFNSAEEARAAIQSGQIPRGATFFINGEEYVNDL